MPDTPLDSVMENLLTAMSEFADTLEVLQDELERKLQDSLEGIDDTRNHLYRQIEQKDALIHELKQVKIVSEVFNTACDKLLES